MKYKTFCLINFTVLGKIMKILKFALIISLSTVIILSELATSKNLQMTLTSNGSQICSDENPSVIFNISRLSSLDSVSSSCVPLSVRCSWECTNDPECTNFNYKEDPGLCELFYSTPKNCSAISGCAHFQVSGTVHHWRSYG